jgi:hypothetical protein
MVLGMRQIWPLFGAIPSRLICHIQTDPLLAIDISKCGAKGKVFRRRRRDIMLVVHDLGDYRRTAEW